MEKKLNIFCIATALCSFIVAFVALVLSIISFSYRDDKQYVLYLGTNDKDTNQMVFESKDACKNKLKEILVEDFGGYTISEAEGGWKDGETFYQEYTLIIYLSDTDIDAVHKLCDKLVVVFRQSSVLIETNKTKTEFYSGK